MELLLSNWAIEQKKKLQIYQKSINSQSLLNQLKYIQKSFFMKSYFWKKEKKEIGNHKCRNPCRRKRWKVFKQDILRRRIPFNRNRLQIFYVLPWQLINFTETASSRKYLIKVYLTMFWWFRFFRKPSIRRYVYEKAGKQNWCFWYLAPRFAPKCVNRCVGFFCLK